MKLHWYTSHEDLISSSRRRGGWGTPLGREPTDVQAPILTHCVLHKVPRVRAFTPSTQQVFVWSRGIDPGCTSPPGPQVDGGLQGGYWNVPLPSLALPLSRSGWASCLLHPVLFPLLPGWQSWGSGWASACTSPALTLPQNLTLKETQIP